MVSEVTDDRLAEMVAYAKRGKMSDLETCLRELKARRDGVIYVEPGQLVGVPPSVDRCNECNEALYVDPCRPMPNWYCLTGCHGSVDENIPDAAYQWAKEKVRVR